MAKFDKCTNVEPRTRECAIEAIIVFLEFLNPEEFPDSDFENTPERFVRAFESFCKPIKLNVKTFKRDQDEMIVSKQLVFRTMCPHHLMPVSGIAHIGYIPKNGIILGASKMARILEHCSVGLRTQESVVEEVAMHMTETLSPLGVAVFISAAHGCMTHRGVKQANSQFVTSKFTGVFLEKGNDARKEFMSIIKGA